MSIEPSQPNVLIRLGDYLNGACQLVAAEVTKPGTTEIPLARALKLLKETEAGVTDVTPAHRSGVYVTARRPDLVENAIKGFPGVNSVTVLTPTQHL